MPVALRAPSSLAADIPLECCQLVVTQLSWSCHPLFSERRNAIRLFSKIVLQVYNRVVLDNLGNVLKHAASNRKSSATAVGPSQNAFKKRTSWIFQVAPRRKKKFRHPTTSGRKGCKFEILQLTVQKGCPLLENG